GRRWRSGACSSRARRCRRPSTSSAPTSARVIWSPRRKPGIRGPGPGGSRGRPSCGRTFASAARRARPGTLLRVAEPGNVAKPRRLILDRPPRTQYFPAMPPRLLLADDSVTVQRVLERTFADEDIALVSAGSGDDASARLEREPFDIVLADVGMPGRDGFEVARFVRERPATAHVPVILLTGAYEQVDAARVAASGASAVLPKPFEPQAVIVKVRELLARRGPAEAAPAPRSEERRVGKARRAWRRAGHCT